MKHLYPIPLWNRTERPANHLPTVCDVLAERRGYRHTQSGVEYLVQKVNGQRVWLDAGWFMEAAQGVEMTVKIYGKVCQCSKCDWKGSYLEVVSMSGFEFCPGCNYRYIGFMPEASVNMIIKCRWCTGSDTEGHDVTCMRPDRPYP